MDSKHRIARRVSQCLHDGDVVNLGIGLPELTAMYAPSGITFHSETGLLGLGPLVSEGVKNSNHFFNASCDNCLLEFGASAFDVATSFGLTRAGRLDVTVLGALQVSEQGDLANWAAPGRFFGMGGAMELAVGAKKVVVAMEHCTKDGKPKIVQECTLPYTGRRCVNHIVTELCVLHVTPNGLLLKEIAPGVTIEEVQAKTGAPVYIADDLKTIEF